jgi:hypothetical protein
MLSDARSLPPHSFSPKEVFDLTKVFEDCSDGNTEWETHSLCEEPKMIESPEDPTEEQPSAKQTKRLLAEKRKEEQKEESAEESGAAAKESSGEEKSRRRRRRRRDRKQCRR